MSFSSRLLRWAGARFSRRMSRAIPVAGGVIALATAGAAMRRKGLVRGTADTALNAMPVVGALKLAVESLRGRDLLKDRAPNRQGSRPT